MRCQTFALFAVLTLLASGTLASAASVNDESANDIARLVRQLDADQFATRQAASNELADMGARAFPALEEAALSGGPEVVQRAIGILAQHFKSDDDEVKAAAQKTLERIAKADGAAAGRAKEVIAPEPAPQLIPRARVGVPIQLQVRAFGGQSERAQDPDSAGEWQTPNQNRRERSKD